MKEQGSFAQSNGPIKAHRITKKDGKSLKCCAWGGDSYVTDDGDDSAENGVLAGGGDWRVIDKWGTLGQGCHSAPFSNAIILSKWSFS